jgi:hypothetical protein
MINARRPMAAMALASALALSGAGRPRHAAAPSIRRRSLARERMRGCRPST